MAFAGLLQVGIEIGLDAILVKPKRQIGPFTAMVTIREEHHDSMEITEQPVEQGASITDHAFKRPAELVLDVGWSNTPNSNAVGSSSSVLGSLAGAVTGTIGGVSSLVNSALNPANGINTAIGQLSDVVTAPLSRVGDFVSGALTNVGSAVTGALDVSSVADQVISNVPGGLTDALSAGSLPGVQDIGGLVGAVSDGVDFSGALDGLSSSLSGSGVGQVNDTYAKFLALQASAEPFDVFTGKRVYSDMLIADMSTVTDKTTENALFLRLRLRQIIIVATAQSSTVTSDQSAQTDPEETSPTSDQGDQNLGDAQTYNEGAGDTSINADPPDNAQEGS